MYCTDLEETQWQVIKKILNLQERKRKYDLREIWYTIFYLVKTGCQWRMLPSNFAPWELVYYYYRKWCSLGEFDLLLNNLREKVRVNMGQKAECSLGKIILADAGYRGEIADKIKTAFGYILEVVVSGDKVNGFKPIGKRWIVERTFSWFDNYRRLCRNDEWTFDSAEEMVKLASIRMLLNKILTGS